MLPLHETLLAGAEQLGWTFRKGRVWARNELQLRFAPGVELEQDAYKLVEVLVVPRGGTADVTVIGRKFPHGQFPVAKATVPIDDAFAAGVRDGLQPVRTPDGAGDQVLEGLIRLLLQR